MCVLCCLSLDSPSFRHGEPGQESTLYYAFLGMLAALQYNSLLRANSATRNQIRLHLKTRVPLVLALFLFLPSALYAQISPDLFGASLLSQLKQDFLTPTVLSYDEARDRMFGEIDRRLDGTVVGVYSSFTVSIPDGVDPSTSAFNQSMNTEHTWPQSKGASGNARADLHHLFPVNSSINSSRGNRAFGNVADDDAERWLCAAGITETKPSGDISSCSKNDFDTSTFEVPDAHKGNVARAMFYFYTMYSAQADAEDPTFFGLQRDVLYQWHKLDPADAAELARTEHIATFQTGKINPFVSDSSLIFRAYFTPDSGGGPVVDGDSETLTDQIWINEFHYDNASSDTGEFVEVVAQSSFSISNITLSLYNGNGGGTYGSAHPLSSFDVGATVDGYTFYALRLPTNGLQNGAPDGLALDQGGSAFQFLSYEGVITATSGPAAGMTSMDIGVAESSSTPAGHSLQLAGSGTKYSDFTWQAPQEDTNGAINTGQSFVNAAPVAVADQVETQEDTAFTFDVLSNDTDPEGASLTVTAVTQPTNGASGIEADGTIRYTPRANFNGIDTFSYTISDGTNEASGQVTVAVNPVNDPPPLPGNFNVRVSSGDPSLIAPPIVLEGVRQTRLNIDWQTPADVDGDVVLQTFRMSLDSLITDILVEQDSVASYDNSLGEFADLLATRGLDRGDTMTVFVQVEARAGGESTKSDVFAVDVIRGRFAGEPEEGIFTVMTDVFTIREDSVATFDVLANDQPAIGERVFILFAETDTTQGARVRVLGDTLIAYQPEPNFHGRAGFAYFAFSGTDSVWNTMSPLRTGVAQVNVLPVDDPPTATVAMAPSDSLTTSGQPSDPLSFSWLPAQDVEGDAITYRFEMGTDSLKARWFTADMGDATTYATTMGELAALLDANGVSGGSSVDLYTRVHSVTDSATTVGPVTKVTVTRGALVSTDQEEVPQELAVSAAYPNPFNQTIQFDVTVPYASHVQLKLYDALGREVAVVVDRMLSNGMHAFVLESTDLPAGVYVYRLSGGEKTKTGLVTRVR